MEVAFLIFNIFLVVGYLVLMFFSFRKMKNTKIEETDSDEYFDQETYEKESGNILKV